MYQDYKLEKQYFLTVIEKLAALIEEERDYLTELDAAIGDADHGFNLSIGFREVMEKLPQWQELDLAQLFKKVGMALLSKVGGAAGPLYGSFFMKFGEPAQGKGEVNFEEFYFMFKAAVEAVEMRGKAVVGEKTMVDALRPGLEAFKSAMDQGKPPRESLEGFADAAKKGADSTIPIVAKKGRAMRLGERAIGHLDPGATSSSMIIRVFLENLPIR